MICNKRWARAACLSPLSLINDERQRHSKRVTAINSSLSRPPLKLLSITSGNVAGYCAFISCGPLKCISSKKEGEEKKRRRGGGGLLFTSPPFCLDVLRGEDYTHTHTHTRYSWTNSQRKLIKSAFGVSAQALTTSSNLAADLLQVCHR